MHRRHRGLRFEWLRGRIFSILLSGKTFVAIRRKEVGLILRFHPPFSRHGIAQILSALGELIWLHEKVGFHPTFSHHGIAHSRQALGELILLNEKVGVRPTFSRHGIAQSRQALALLIWLHEKVGFHPTFSRHGIAQSQQALALLIWLNEKVPSRTSKCVCTDAKIFPALVKILSERELSVKEIIFIGQPLMKANHSPTYELILLVPAEIDMMTVALRPPPYMDRPLLADSR